MKERKRAPFFMKHRVYLDGLPGSRQSPIQAEATW